jgi:hypothetical protein
LLGAPCIFWFFFCQHFLVFFCQHFLVFFLSEEAKGDHMEHDATDRIRASHHQSHKYIVRSFSVDARTCSHSYMASSRTVDEAAHEITAQASSTVDRRQLVPTQLTRKMLRQHAAAPREHSAAQASSTVHSRQLFPHS